MPTRWPWLSLLLLIVIVISPLGREIIHDAFFSGEALSRNIAQFMLYIGQGIAVLVAVLDGQAGDLKAPRPRCIDPVSLNGSLRGEPCRLMEPSYRSSRSL